MPTVIDSLVVTLGLDPSKFTQGQKDALAAFKATQDEAQKVANDMESRGKQAAEFFSQIKTQVVGLLAVFTAGYGIKEFMSHTVETNAAVGRLAKNVGVAVNELTAWEGVARRSGAASEDVDASLTSLTQEFQNFALTGQSAVIPYFRALGVQVSDINTGKMRPLNDILLDLADKFKGMQPATAQAFGRGLGLTPGMINTLMQGREALIALRKEVDEIGHANDDDVRAATRLQQAWRALTDASQDIGTKLLTAVAPALEAVAKALSELLKWAAQHPRVVQAFTAVIGVVTGLGIALAVLTSPIALTVAGIAALAAGVALLWDDWQTFTNGGKSAFEGFWRVVEDGWKLIKALFTGSADDIREAWGELFKDLEKLFSGVVDFFVEVGPRIGKAIIDGFGSAFDWVQDRWNTLKQLFGFGKATTSAPGAPASAPAAAPAPGAPRVAGGSSTTGTRPVAGTTGSMVDKLVALGWTREQAIGIAANIHAESGGDPNAVGDSGKAYGLGQWHPDRQAEFKKWAGHDIRGSSADEQLGFIDYELRQGKERAAGAALAKTKTAGEAAEVVSRKYERPAAEAAEAAKRAQVAMVIAGGAPLDSAVTRSTAASKAAGGAATTNNSHEVNIQTINVNAPNATDADGVAKGIGRALKQNASLPSLNTGLQ